MSAELIPAFVKLNELRNGSISGAHRVLRVVGHLRLGIEVELHRDPARPQPKETPPPPWWRLILKQFTPFRLGLEPIASLRALFPQTMGLAGSHLSSMGSFHENRKGRFSFV